MTKVVEKAVKDAMEYLSDLSVRWDEERAFEDFADYKKAMEAHIKNAGGLFLKMFEDKMKVVFTVDTAVVAMWVAGNQIKCNIR